MADVMAIFSKNPWLWVVALFALSIVCKTITRIIGYSVQERTRREIAAYIAEGSMTPEDGHRLLAAKMSGKGDSCC